MPRKRGRWGNGGTTRRPNGRWQAQWSTTEGGKRVRKSATFVLQSEAEWWLREKRRGHSPATDETVGEYLDEWLRGKRKIRASTHRLYESHVRVHLRPALGDFGMMELRERHVQSFVDGLTVSPGTVKLILGTLRAALRTAEDKHLIHDNPAKHVEAPEVRRPPVEALTPKDALAIIDAVTGTWIEHVVRFLIGSGCRIGEACDLNQEDVMDGFVRIRRPKTQPRATFVSEDGMEALREAIRLAPRVGRNEPVFFGPKTGDRLTRETVTHALPRLLEAAGLPALSPHKLRHGAASMMAADGWSMKIIAEQLGNSEALVARTYAHISPSVQRRAVGSLDVRKA